MTAMFQLIQGIGRGVISFFERLNGPAIALLFYLLGGLVGFLAAHDWYTSPFEDEEAADPETNIDSRAL